MAANVEITKNPNENALQTVRRFSRKVQSWGGINRLKKNRYKSRPQSEYAKKKQALKKLRRRSEVKHLIKLGKLPDKMKN